MTFVRDGNKSLPMQSDSGVQQVGLGISPIREIPADAGLDFGDPFKGLTPEQRARLAAQGGK